MYPDTMPATKIPEAFCHPRNDRPQPTTTPFDKGTITTRCASRAFSLARTCRSTEHCIKFDKEFVDGMAKHIIIQPDFTNTRVIIQEEFMTFFGSTAEGKLWKTAFGTDIDLSDGGFESTTNEELKCPITFEPFSKPDAAPVVAADGHFYSEAAIKRVIDDAQRNYEPIARSPLTNEPLANDDLRPLASLGRKAAYLHEAELKRARAFFAMLVPSVFTKFVAKAIADEDAKRAAEYDSKLAEFVKKLEVQHECLKKMYPVPPTPEHLYTPFGGNVPPHPSKPALSLVAAVRSGLHTHTHPEGPWQVPGVGPTCSIIAQVHRWTIPGIPQHTLVEYMSDDHRKEWSEFRKSLRSFREKRIKADRWIKPQAKPPKNVD